MIEVGVIGCGNVVAGTHLPLLAGMNGVRVKFLVDLIAPRDLARDFGGEAIAVGDNVSSLPGCDILLVATPVGVRAPYIEEYARRDTMIFTEKPFAVDVVQHRRFLTISDRMACNYVLLFLSWVRQLAYIVSSGVFGKLRTIILRQGGIVGATGKAKEHYQANVALSGGGILMERGCHTLSWLSYILRDYDFTIRDATIRWHGDLDVDVHAFLEATGENDVDVEYRISIIEGFGTGARFVFDNAVVTLDQMDKAAVLHVHGNGNDGPGLRVDPWRGYAVTGSQAFYLSWQRVLSLFRGELQVDAVAETSLATTRLIDGIYERAEASR